MFILEVRTKLYTQGGGDRGGGEGGGGNNGSCVGVFAPVTILLHIILLIMNILYIT